VFFRDGDGGSMLETLELKAAYCVSYHEQFVSGDARGGAYQCFLTLSDPDGWTLQAGGPAAAFMAPAAREHGLPAAVQAAQMVGQQALIPTVDWMAAQQADKWEGKKQSNKAYLGSPPLKRRQLQQMQTIALSKYGTTVKVLKEGDEMLTMMRSMQRRAAFQASSNTVFLQPQATYYELSHELKHAEQCAVLGVKSYASQSSLEKETYVYEQLLKNKSALSDAEIKHATGYINSERNKAGLPSLST
jgi:hypothetical protein